MLEWFNEFLKEASIGRIDTGFIQNVLFNSKIYENNKLVLEYTNTTYPDLLIPTLIIKDLHTFLTLLKTYIEKAKSFYQDKRFEDVDNLDKYLTAALFADATTQDFNDPIHFLERRINFLDDTLSSSLTNEEINLGTINNHQVKAHVYKDFVYNETPYAIYFTLDTYTLPTIRYGIHNDTVNIYAIQSKKQEKDVTYKQVNRYLYKIGEGFDITTDTPNIGNINEISPSSVIASFLFLKFFNDQGFTKFNINPSSIIRYNSKIITALNHHEYSNDTEDKINYIYTNMNDKLIRNFRRLASHTDAIEILSLPMDVDNSLSLHANIIPNCTNNTLLNEITNLNSQTKKL